MMECTNPGLFSAGPDWLEPGEQRRHEALWQVARGRAEGEGGVLRRHVEECRACARLVASFRRLDGAMVEGGAAVFAACPSAQDLSDFHYYELPVDAREKVDEHLKVCPYCREDLAWIVRTADSKVVAMRGRRMYWLAAAALVLLTLIPVMRYLHASRYADLAQIPAIDRADLIATLGQPERFRPAFEEALNAYQAGDYRTCELKVEAILMLAPTDPSALLVKAMDEYKQGNTKAAVALMDQSERTAPMSAFRCWATLQLGLATGDRARVERECKHLEGHPQYAARVEEIREAVRKRG
jgi:anti-sigma factor RsiW